PSAALSGRPRPTLTRLGLDPPGAPAGRSATGTGGAPRRGPAPAAPRTEPPGTARRPVLGVGPADQLLARQLARLDDPGGDARGTPRSARDRRAPAFTPRNG